MKKETYYCTDGKHAVNTLTDTGKGKMRFRAEVCAECPWRKDAPIGAFPPDAYRHSATTAYDQALNTFACHMSVSENKVATCAGFLLANAVNNLGIRIAYFTGRFDPSKLRKTVPLYASYRAMAIANGVSRNDPALRPCRGNNDEWKPQHRSRLDAVRTRDHDPAEAE